MICQINDMRIKARLASAAAAVVITALMLVCVGLGFPGPVSAGEASLTQPAAVAAAISRFE